MPTILLAAPERDRLSAFADALAKDPAVSLAWAGSAAEVLAAVREQAPALVVIDSNLPEPAALVSDILRMNAMVNTAVVSDMEEEAFHEATEGLGIMCRLPPSPGPRDAEETLEALRRLTPFG